MYAVIETGGKQYRVAKGDLLEVERFAVEGAKQEVAFDKVLLIGENETVQIGTPYLEKARVMAEVLGEGKGKKVIAYRYKRRKGYDKKRGHRQIFTTVRIKEIRG